MGINKKKNQARRTPVNNDFDKGTTAPEAQNMKKKIRAAKAKLIDSDADEVVKTGPRRNAKTEAQQAQTHRLKSI